MSKLTRKYIALEDLVEAIIDNRGKTVPTSVEGIPLIATNCIKHSSIYPTYDNIRYISSETFDTWFRAHLKPNDILFVNKGTPGRVCVVPNPVKFCAAQDMVGLRFKESVDYRYMFAVLRSDEIQKTIANNHVGLVIPHFRKQELVKMQLPIVDITVQRKIGQLYFDISNKIELNNRINTELEAMAKTIYDYWFVQFDFPDANGKPYKSSGGKMVYNDVLKREVPEGWEVDKLDSYIERIIDYRGRTPKKLNYDWSENPNDIIALSAKHLKDGKLVNLNDANRVSPALYKLWMKEELKEGDILMTSEAPLGEFFYLVGETKYCLSQRLFAIRADESKVKSSYLFFELSKGNGFSQIIGKQSGSTVFGIRQDELRKVFILKPSSFLQEAFDSKIKKIYPAIRNNEYQNQQLSQLRDWLLPMLMNGQVSVADAYQEAAQALSMAAEDAAGYGKKK